MSTFGVAGPPTVNSDNQKERILARRERISERVEQIAEPNKPVVSQTREKVPSIAHDIATNTKTECIAELEDFEKSGANLLSDVRIAAQNHEAERRGDQERQQREMIEKLETEARTEQDKFQEILNKWNVDTPNYRTPQDLHSLLVDQTKSCSQVVQQKQKIIDELKQVARQADDQYMKDLKRQNKDMEIISKRMENHVQDMNGNFTGSLKKIEQALLSDRDNTLNSALNKSEKAWKARALREIEMVYEHLELGDKYTKELDEIRQKGAEEFAIIKDKLERDVSAHEQQLQQMRAIYQLNQEKLVYNHEILRNREDENNIIKAQQKRKITKLQDQLNTVRQKLVKTEQQYKNASLALSENYDKIVQQHKELEKKRTHFSNAESKRFHELWKMNFNTVKNLAAQCLQADRIIHRQQIGLVWNKDDEKVWFVPEDFQDVINAANSSTSASTMMQSDPVLAPWQEATLRKSATDVVKSGMSSDSASSNDSGAASPSEGLTKVAEQITKNTKLSIQSVRTLLPLLAEEGDFLFEEKLSTLLSSLEPSHSTLIKLDAIFSALGIQTADDITLLTEELNRKIGDNPQENINKIVPALKDYIKRHTKTDDMSAKILGSRNSKASALTGQEWAALEPKYWAEMQEVISTRKLRIWDALDQALPQYNDVLKERRQLIVETDNLKKQNAELRMLLQQYLSSKVNKELQIPPTRVLQSEAK